MRSKSNSIWQRAAMMTIIGTTLYGTAFASEAVLPKEAIPRLQLPTQETLLESKNEHQKTSKAVAKQTQAAINPNQLYADKRLINPYTAYMWREDNEIRLLYLRLFARLATVLKQIPIYLPARAWIP